MAAPVRAGGGTRAGGAERDLTSVVAHSADLASWLTAPEFTRHRGVKSTEPKRPSWRL